MEEDDVEMDYPTLGGDADTDVDSDSADFDKPTTTATFSSL